MALIPVSEILRQNKMLIIGHRGIVNHPEIPENTIRAFQTAVEFGADGVELDLMQSRDNEVLIFHDTDLTRMFNLKKKFRDFPASDLTRMIFPAASGEPDYLIPRLTTMFGKLGKTCYYNLEIKEWYFRPTAFLKKIHQIISEYEMESLVWISSFNPRVMAISKKVNPNVLTAFLFSRLNLAVRSVLNKPYIDVLHPDVKLIQKLPEFRKFQKPLVFWTVNNEQDIKKLIGEKVAGIITDNIQLCRKVKEKSH